MLLLTLHRAWVAANGVVLLDGYLDACAKTFLRSPFRSFCVGALSGAMLGSIGALVAPEMFVGLALVFAICGGLLAAAIAGAARREHSAASTSCIRLPYRPDARRRPIRARLALAAVPMGICLAVAILSQRSLVIVILISAVGSWLLIAAAGAIALAGELFGAAGKFLRRTTMFQDGTS
jgi:hypothetical protein